MLEGCISGSIHFVMMVKEDEGPDRQIHGVTRTRILVMDRVYSVRNVTKNPRPPPDYPHRIHSSHGPRLIMFVERFWIHGKVNNELIERIIVNVKNGGKQASSYTVNLCRKEMNLAQHAKVNI